MTFSSQEHAARIEAIGLPPVLVRIAVEGGAAAHPALRGHMDGVWTPAWSIVELLLPAEQVEAALQPIER